MWRQRPAAGGGGWPQLRWPYIGLAGLTETERRRRAGPSRMPMAAGPAPGRFTGRSNRPRATPAASKESGPPPPPPGITSARPLHCWLGERDGRSPRSEEQTTAGPLHCQTAPSHTNHWLTRCPAYRTPNASCLSVS